MNATAKWLVCGASFGWVLSATWADAAAPSLSPALAASILAPTATDLEADNLTKARDAMSAGKLDEAERFIAEAEKHPTQRDSLWAGGLIGKDSPEKARRDLEKLRSQNEPRTPSSRFSAWPGSSSASARGVSAEKAPQDPFAARAGEGTLDRLTSDNKSKAVKYLENGRQALAARDIPGAIAWQQKATAEQATFGPGEYSPQSLADELRRAGVDANRLTAAAAPRFDSHFAPEGERDLATRVPSYEPDAMPRTAITSLDQIQPDTNPLTRGGPQVIQNNTLGAAHILAEARKAVAAGNVRGAAELAKQARAQGVIAHQGDSPDAIDALIQKSNQLSAGPRPGTDPAQFSQAYAQFLMEQSEGLLRYQLYGEAEQLAQQAKGLNVRYGSNERTPDQLLGHIAALQNRPAAAESQAAEPRALAMPTSPRRLPAPQAASAPSPVKQEALRLMANARLALDRGDVEVAHRMALEAQNLRVPETEFSGEEMRPWQLVLDTSRALNLRQGGPQVMQAGNIIQNPNFNERGEYAVQPGVYDPSNDPSRNMAASAAEDARERSVFNGDLDTAGLQYYEAGMKAFTAGDRETAHQHFKQAWKFNAQLEPALRSQLKDKLLALDAPRPEPLPTGNASPLAQVDQKTDVLRQKILKEIQAEDKEVERLATTDPERALDRLRTLRERVNAAELDGPSRKQLLVFVDRKIGDMERYLEENRVQIDLDKANRRVRDGIELESERLVATQTKLAELVEEFNSLMKEQRYHEAEVIAKRAREIAPEEGVVVNMVWQSKFAREYAAQMAIRERKEAGVLAALGSVEDSSTPYNDNEPITFNTKIWGDLTKRRMTLLEQTRRKYTPTELAIQASLDKPVEVNFVNRPLAEVMDTLGKMANINIYLDPQGMHAEGIDSNTPVNLNLATPISLRSALDLILDQLRMAYVIQNEVLKVTSKQASQSNLVRVVYNVGDLVIPIPNFTPSYNMGLPGAIREAHNTLGYGGAFAASGSAPMTLASAQGPTAINPLALGQMGGSGSFGGGRPDQVMSGPGSLGGAAAADFDSLIDLITSTVHPDSWKEGGGTGEGTIAPFPTNLSIVVSQTEEVHKDIGDLLEQLRRLQDLQVTIEVRFITLNDNFFERIGVDFDFNIDDNTGGIPILPDDTGPSMVVGLDPTGQLTNDRDVQFRQNSFATAIPQFGGFDPSTAANFGFAILSDIEVYFLLQAASGDTRTNVLQAPKVTLFNGQQAVVSDTSQKPFVTSVVPVVGDFAAAHQPVITVLSEGTSMSVQAVVSADRRFVRLTLVPFFSQIGDVEEFTFTGTTTTNTGTAVVDPTNPGRTLNDDNSTTRSGTTVQLPTFSFTTVTTTVSVPDGGTVLLGGIKRLSEGRTERGVPLLNKIPYASRLFKNVGIGRQTQSLMMMVTPRIIIQEEEEAKLGIDIGN